MEPELPFESEEPLHNIDNLTLILGNIQNLYKHFLQLVEKIEQLLLSFKTVILSKASMNENHNSTYKYESNSNISNITVVAPTVGSLNEIAGLKQIKAALTILIVLPMHQPQLFQNRAITNNILLYGPPGTGKTRIVHGVAAEAGARFYTISPSDLLSSYVGETEKNIKEIFLHLKTSDHFSILFIDEIDGLCRKRSSTENEFTRRIKTELMCQITQAEQNRNMVLIAATNCPWDLDSAVIRRFRKRIYVPLPNSEERLELFQLFTKDIHVINTSAEVEQLIQISEGFSGSDISGLIQDALDIPVTELLNIKIWHKTADGFFEPYSDNDPTLKVESILVSEMQNLPPFSVKARTVKISDFLEAAKQVQVSVKLKDLEMYQNFQNEI